MEAENDGVLVARMRHGDEEAFVLFVNRYKNPLINYLTHLTRGRERAEDVAQETFVRFYRNLNQCRAQERLGPYLFRIATNLAHSQGRRERRWGLLLPMLRASDSRRSPLPDAPLLTNEIQRQVAAALDRLPLRYRAPLVLFEIEEWSQEEIAEALGCRLGTVKSRISRARALMRKELESWWVGATPVGGTHGRDWKPVEATAQIDGLAPIHR